MFGISVGFFFPVEDSKTCLLEMKEEEKERDSAAPGFVC